MHIKGSNIFHDDLQAGAGLSDVAPKMYRNWMSSIEEKDNIFDKHN